MNNITVVMATYNGESYVEAQVESIIGSTYANLELHIYDDGSTDNTIHLLYQLRDKYSDKIKIIQNENNLGVAVNFLHAISRTESDYVMLSDQDDVWNKDKIELTLKKMKETEEARKDQLPVAVFTDAFIADQDLNILHNSFFQSGHLDPLKTDLPHLLMENKLLGCTVMINASLRDIIKNHTLPKRVRYHDGWIALIAASLGAIGYLNQATMLYRQHGNNIVGNKSFPAYVKNRLLSMKKQRTSLLLLQAQAEEFLRIYEEQLPAHKTQLLRTFSQLHRMSFIKRRIQVLRNGYLKTGFIRNFGLMIII